MPVAVQLDITIPFYGFKCLYDAFSLMAVLYLCEWVGTAFPAVTVQSGDCMCSEMVTKALKLLFHLPEHGLDLKMAGIYLDDISRSHGQGGGPFLCTARVPHKRYSPFLPT